jgi:F0F1-type ATP synthase assembly protein I
VLNRSRHTIKEYLVYTILKVGISALLIVGVSEASKRSTLLGGLLASLPLTSLLAFFWLYRDTRDPAKLSALSTNIFWLVLPSLVLFLTLPVFLKRMTVGWALLAAIASMLAAYGAMLGVLRLLNIRI